MTAAAAGVEAVWQPPEGGGAEVTVRAPRVVVACGSLESPALLARSGIGGPATGRYLRLHPSSVVGALYGTDQQAWWGAPQAGLCDQFADTGDGYGFLIETAQYAPGADRLGDAMDLRRRPQAADGAVPLHGNLHRPHPRPRPRRGRGGRQRRGRPDLLRSATRSTWATCAAGSRSRSASTRRRDPTRSSRCAGSAPTWRRGEDLERLHRVGQADPIPRRRPQALQRPPDGHLPDGHGPRDLGRRSVRRAA